MPHLYPLVPQAARTLLATIVLALLTAVSDTPLAVASEQLTAAAATPRADARSTGAGKSDRFSRGLLWKIEGAQGQPSHIFGTIHSPDPRVTQLAPSVRSVFDQAASFTMELLINANGVASMAEAMFFTEGKSLSAVLGQELYEQTRQAVAATGLATDDLDRQKPWVVVMLLSTPRAQLGLPLDMQLQLQATLQGKAIYGLETMNEQIAVFNDMSMADQVALLKETLVLHIELTRQFDVLMQAYLARDLEQLMAIVDQPKRQRSDAFVAMMDRLLGRRNAVMLERMRARLREGNAFIAVGAAHLQGLLQLLEDAGYRVSVVY
jgi:uncharacterized protein YbaP (TraB family)